MGANNLLLTSLAIGASIVAPMAQAATTFHHIRGLSDKALKLAQQAYQCEKLKGNIHNPHLTIVDFTKPSVKKRMWVLDMKHHRVDYHLLASHGQASGDLYATHFSNRENSHQSSRGLFLTSNTYHGRFGYSMRLVGLEKGINDNAYERDIVMHGSKYVNQAFIKKYHRIGRTWGCIGLNKPISKHVINTISNGSLLFVYAKQENNDPNLKQCKA